MSSQDFLNIRTHFDRRSANFDTSPWASDEDLFRRIESWVGFNISKVILDAGGGTGIMGAHLSESHANCLVFNIDISMQMARVAGQKGVPTIVGNIVALPLKSNSVDVILLRQVLPYISRPELALQECWRVLRAGGQLLVGQFVAYNDADRMWLNRILPQWKPLSAGICLSEELLELLASNRFVPEIVDQVDLMESLMLWLERYQMPVSRRREAMLVASREIDYVCKERRIVLAENDVQFSNLFVIIDARK